MSVFLTSQIPCAKDLCDLHPIDGRGLLVENRLETILSDQRGSCKSTSNGPLAIGNLNLTSKPKPQMLNPES